MFSKLENNQCKCISKSLVRKNDRHFWATISPFFSDKRFRKWYNISTKRQRGNRSQQCFWTIQWLFFAGRNVPWVWWLLLQVILSIRTILTRALRKYDKIWQRMYFQLQPGWRNCVALMLLRTFNQRKSTGCDHIPGKIVRIAHQVLSFLTTLLINRVIWANAFQWYKIRWE